MVRSLLIVANTGQLFFLKKTFFKDPYEPALIKKKWRSKHASLRA
jgi:hypothetical protein